MTPEPIAPQLACHPAGWEETAANLLTAIHAEIDDLAASGTAPGFRLFRIREHVAALGDLLEISPAPAAPAPPIPVIPAQTHYLVARFREARAARRERWRDRLDIAAEIALGAIAFPATLAGIFYVVLWWAR